MSKRYSVTICENCGQDLTAKNAVIIETRFDEPGGGFTPGCLDGNGILREVYGIVASGLHCDSFCSRCSVLLTPTLEKPCLH